MIKVTFKSNADRVAAKIAGIEKEILKEAKRKTRAFLRIRVSKLQRELDFLVNQYERTPGTNKDLTPQPLAQSIAEKQAFGENRKVNYGDDFHTTMDSPIIKAAVVNTDTGGNLVARVRDDNLHPDAVYEDYRDSFASTLSNKVFAIQDGVGGSYRYYIIEPGSILLNEVLESVKIFCSSFKDSAGAGRPDGDPLQDIGLKKGREKFERDKEKGFTEFTLKESAFKAIQERGKDVTGIVLNTQHGEYQDASTIAAQYKSSAMRDAFNTSSKDQFSSSAMKDAFARANDAAQGKNITPEAKAVANTNKAISNITIKEQSSENTIKYTIQTTIDDKEFVSGEVIQAAKREVLLWATESSPELKSALEQALDKALKDFNKGA